MSIPHKVELIVVSPSIGVLTSSFSFYVGHFRNCDSASERSCENVPIMDATW